MFSRKFVQSFYNSINSKEYLSEIIQSYGIYVDEDFTLDQLKKVLNKIFSDKNSEDDAMIEELYKSYEKGLKADLLLRTDDFNGKKEEIRLKRLKKNSEEALETMFLFFYPLLIKNVESICRASKHELGGLIYDDLLDHGRVSLVQLLKKENTDKELLAIDFIQANIFTELSNYYIRNHSKYKKRY